MSSPDEMMHQVGGFDPKDARRVLEALEAAGIRFEIEADHSDLLQAGRTVQMALGMYPTGSKVLIFVPEMAITSAQEIIAHLFPT